MPLGYGLDLALVMPSNLLPKDGEAFLHADLFAPSERERFFSRLEKEIEWRQEPIRIFGKMVMQPRLTAWLGEHEYRYSGIVMKPQKWNSTLNEIKAKIEPLAGLEFNCALLNFYRDGQDSMGWHRDNERELGIDPVIGSVSFGAARRFLLRHFEKKKLKTEILLGDGSFLLMKGATQHQWEHSLPKTAQVVGPRINLTFRVIR
jgi:alkylated DNA repair dioxygenase AlkB